MCDHTSRCYNRPGEIVPRTRIPNPEHARSSCQMQEYNIRHEIDLIRMYQRNGHLAIPQPQSPSSSPNWNSNTNSPNINTAPPTNPILNQQRLRAIPTRCSPSLRQLISPNPFLLLPSSNFKPVQRKGQNWRLKSSSSSSKRQNLLFLTRHCRLR
jgi:hypothetical protein